MGVSNLDRVNASKRVGGALNVGLTNNIITNTLVNGNATLTGLKAAITAAIVRSDDVPLASDVNDALDLGKNIGIFSETHGQTTVAGLVGLSDATASFRQGLRA
jgi:hypothetical protein